MKILFTFLVFFLSVQANARPDLPPDASSTQYRNAYRLSATSAKSDDGLDGVVAAGERNLNWLIYINSFRPNDPLSLTSKDTQSAYPIDTPMTYNPQLVIGRFNDLKAKYPAELAAVVFDGKPYTKEPPIAVADYIENSRALDKIYQSAIRWRMMAPYLDELKDQRARDIRGLYFLEHMTDRAQKLAHFSNLTAADQQLIRQSLIGMCLNNDDSTTDGCNQEIAAAITAGTDLETIYQKYLSAAQATWSSFFTIPNGVARMDFKWTGDVHGTGVFQTPFMDPVEPRIRDFLQLNIQDEWRFGGWHLELPFEKGDPDHMTHVVFQPGSTPHVNKLGGLIITMDANQPLTEYDAQWTIRHEYGHVLGLPDCYVEFYIEESGVIMSYQLDIDNIMCSRRGHVKDTDVLELQRVYATGRSGRS